MAFPNQQQPTPAVAAAPVDPGASGGPPSPSYTPPGKPPPVHPNVKIPPSQFHKSKELPPIDLQPLQMPDTHVTPEYCLEEMGRILQELAEKQEDPLWVSTHVALADAWRSAAELLLNHAVQGQQMLGDAHLKQQQLNQNEDVHAQTLAQNDQKHAQNMKQTDDQHGQKLKQNDDLHSTKLDQQKQQADQQAQLAKQKAAASAKKSAK